MYTRWLDFLNSKKIVLGSQSEFRKECLQDLNLKFDVIISGFAEDIEKTNISPNDYVNKTAYGKFDTFMKKYQKCDCDIVICSDTIVDFNGQIIEKPNNPEELAKFLKLFSNNCVNVLTCIIVAILEKDKDGNNIVKQFKQDISSSKVYFQELNDDVIQDYIKFETKAYEASGGFACSGKAKTLITKVDGCFYASDGFPVQLFIQILLDLVVKEYGPNAWKK